MGWGALGERGVKEARAMRGGCVWCVGCTRLAAGVAVLIGDPIGERLPIVRGAAGSDGRVGHGGHSDRADESGRDWRRRRDAFDAEGRRPEGLMQWLSPPRRLDELLPETPDMPDKAAVQEEPDDIPADGYEPDYKPVVVSLLGARCRARIDPPAVPKQHELPQHP